MQQPKHMEATAANVAVMEQGTKKPRRQGGALWRGLWSVLTANNKMTIGLSIVGIFVLIALIGPILFPMPANPFDHPVSEPPSAQYWFGTTTTGKNLFIQFVHGTGPSILMGLVVGFLATIISVVIGLTAGYFGGWVDNVLSVVTNVVIVIPALPLAIVLAAFLRDSRGPLMIIFVLLLTTWAWGARVLRAQTMSLRKREFVIAARAVGESPLRIIFREILPNEIAIVASSLVSTIVYALLAAISLEFLGLGDPSGLSWGSTLYEAQSQQAMLIGMWWWFVPSGLAMAILGAGLTLVSYGIDELANPRLRKEKVVPEKLAKNSTATPPVSTPSTPTMQKEATV